MYCTNYMINDGDTLYRISRHFNVGLQSIMDANPFINVYNLVVGDTILIPVSIPQNNYTHYTTYLIREGDTLGSILNENSINLADLMVFNELSDIFLQPGTTLQVPIPGEDENGVTL